MNVQENQILVKALRPFEGEEGFKSSGSEPFHVTRQRFAELNANGLVMEVAAADDGASATADTQAAAEKQANDEAAATALAEKAAAKPSNKAAAKPENK